MSPRDVRKLAILPLIVVTLLFASLGTESALAQSRQRPGGSSSIQSSAVNRFFFQPRFVLTNAEAIGLTEEQRAAIEAAVHESQEAFRRARFELTNTMAMMAGLAVQVPVDEAQMLEQLERVLDLERQIKESQLRSLVRVKNALTPEQHRQLDELRQRQPREPFRQQPPQRPERPQEQS